MPPRCRRSCRGCPRQGARNVRRVPVGRTGGSSWSFGWWGGRDSNPRPRDYETARPLLSSAYIRHFIFFLSPSTRPLTAFLDAFSRHASASGWASPTRGESLLCSGRKGGHVLSPSERSLPSLRTGRGGMPTPWTQRRRSGRDRHRRLLLLNGAETTESGHISAAHAPWKAFSLTCASARAEPPTISASSPRSVRRHNPQTTRRVWGHPGWGCCRPSFPVCHAPVAVPLTRAPASGSTQVATGGGVSWSTRSSVLVRGLVGFGPVVVRGPGAGRLPVRGGLAAGGVRPGSARRCWPRPAAVRPRGAPMMPATTTPVAIARMTASGCSATARPMMSGCRT